jgi:acetoin utilization deacetylase AcuC-like enzyme
MATNPAQTGFLYDERFLDHDDPDHPENARRLRAITALLDQSGIAGELYPLPIRPATEAEIAAVHDRRLIEALQILAYEGGGPIGLDTYMTSDSWAAAALAAGAVIQATEAVVRGEVSNAFALVRPPGHHATPTRSMGFCLINNVAVAAQYAREQLGIERVAIIDWDTHHGNGTQDIFYDDAHVLYCSTHTWPLFPGTGDWREMGEGSGLGLTLNVPLPYYLDDEGYNQAYDQLIIPAVRHFRPEIILVSAGYDAHWSDPLAPMNATVAGFASIARKVYNLAADVCSGRLVCALEGGYNLQALAACVLATLRVLQGRADLVEDPLGPRMASGVEIDATVSRLLHTHPLLAQ